MGTYGVTHIKKNNKTIPFSDSYDGYWSGMAQANLMGLKHIPLTILSKLFDNFTARKPLSEQEATIFEEPDFEENLNDFSQRKLSNFIAQVSLDTNNNQEAIDWAKNSVTGDIRTSMVGVVPLLYMNIHPHYGYNYDYADYVIDLDKNLFTFIGVDLSIPLETIQQTHESNIAYLFENDYSLIDATILPENFDSIEEFLYEGIEENKQDNLKTVNTIINAIFSIPIYKVEEYFDNKEKERQEYINQHTASLANKTHANEDLSYSYSIYTAEVSSQQLRNILFFLQEKAKQLGYAFILDCAEWGLDENYIQGGIRFKSPHDSQEYEKFSEIMLVLEYSLKQRFNIMSGAGTGLGFIEDVEENLTLHKSIFSFEELQNMLADNDFQLVMNESLPYLAYHSYLDEAVSHVIAQNGKTNSPVFWVFVALVSQNKHLFDVVYPKAIEQLLQFELSDQHRIKQLYLSSYYDGVLLATVLNKQTDFVHNIKSTSLFNDCSDILNDMEKQSLLH